MPSPKKLKTPGLYGENHFFKEFNYNFPSNAPGMSLWRDSYRAKKAAVIRKLLVLGRISLGLNKWWEQQIKENATTEKWVEDLQDLEDESLSANLMFDASKFKANRQRRLSPRAAQILKKHPSLRTPDEVYFAMIALRAHKLISQYPVRMQRHLAQWGYYESFGSKRVILRQGQAPVGFYFILYGTIAIAVTKKGQDSASKFVELSRGQSFGELSILHNSNRTSTVVSKGSIELLNISKEVYQQIFMVGGVKNLNDPDHEGFLASLHLFQGWPKHILLKNVKDSLFMYFPRGATILKDSQYSSWIVVVKSGSVAVLKKLIKPKVNVSRVTGQMKGLTFSEDERFEAFLSGNYKKYLERNRVVLPEPIGSATYPVKMDLESQLIAQYPRLAHSASAGGSANRRESIRQTQSAKSRWASLFSHIGAAREAQTGREPQTTRRLSAVIKVARKTARQEYTRPAAASILEEDSEMAITQTGDEYEHPSKPRTYLDDLNIGGSIKPHTLTEADKKPQFVIIQTLTKGSVFGLADLIYEDQPNFSLVSNGSECILVNKKFYVNNCPTPLMNNLLKVVSPFPCEADIQAKLATQLDWEALREATYGKIRDKLQDEKIERLNKGKFSGHRQ